MRRSELIDFLIAETGGLRPDTGTTQTELTDLRSALLVAGDRGASTTPGSAQPHHAVDDALRTEFGYLVGRRVATAPLREPTIRLVRRGAPLPDTDDGSTPDWAVAVRPERTFGPFRDADGRRVWFDLFRPAKRWFVVRLGAAGAVLVVLPWPVGQRPDADGPVGDIAPGTVWVAAPWLAPGAPPQGWVGFRVNGGTISVDGAAQFTPGQLAVASGARVSLSLALEADTPRQEDNDGEAGAEAAETGCAMPRTVTLVLDPDGPGTVGELEASLTVYGQEIDLRRDAGGAPPKYSIGKRRILVPLSERPDRLTVTETHSTLFTPSGSARIRQSYWKLPVTTDPAHLLGEAAGTGSLLLQLSPGLRVGWYGLEGDAVPLRGADVTADRSSLRFKAYPAEGRRARQVFRLWEETEGTRSGRTAAEIRSRLEVVITGAYGFTFSSHRAGTDEFSAHGVARPWMDRPRTAAGQRVDSALRVTYRMLHDPGGITLTLDSKTSDPESRGRRSYMALALTNALLTTTAPYRLSLVGRLAGPGRLDSGDLGLSFRLHHLLPTLPDPYAANFQSYTARPTHRDTPEVRTQVTWTTPLEAVLAVELMPEVGAAGMPTELLPAPEPLPIEAEGEDWELAPEFEEWLGARQRRSGLVLLDVSSFADQLGVALSLSPQDRRAPFTVEELTLRTEANNALVFLLPQFQWEPVRNRANPLTHDKDDLLTYRSDGGPTLMGAHSVTLVPVTPVQVAGEVLRAHEEGDADAAVLFTLPFGMKAVVRLSPTDPAFKGPATLQMLRTRFTGFTGARRLSLRAGVRAESGPTASSGSPPPLLIGRTIQTATFTGTGSPNPDLHSVLGPLEGDFNSAFRHEVPLSRIDFSGYGASLASRWVNDSGGAARISQVTFDGYNGRTAFERIQLTTLLVPCFAVVVRTITLERYGSGAVVRWDSGWTATTPGLFRHPNFGRVANRGAVRGMFDIREIHDTDTYVELAADGGSPVARMQAVYYDADAAIDGVMQGQDGDGRVPAHGHLGFVQRIPLEEPVSSMGVGALTPSQLQELFDTQGPIGGPVDCTVRVGVSPHTMRVTGVYADGAGVNPSFGEEQFAVALYGSPNLPGAGQWSVVRVNTTAKTVGPVDGQLGVPLVRRNNASPRSPNRYPFRWADPRDLFASLSDPPQADYALLFAGVSQRILYRRPTVGPDDADITSTLAPLLADPYTMLRSGGLFPSLDEAMALDQPYPLSLASGRLTFVPDTATCEPGGRTRRLVNASSWNAEAQYAEARFTVDTAADWRIAATKVKHRLEFSPLRDILTFVHDVSSPAVGVTAFPEPEVRPGPALAPVTEVLDLLRKLVPGGAEEQGLPGPLHVASSFTGTSYRLSAVADFMLQGRQGEGVECGIGKVRGGLKLGAELVADLLAADIGGSVFLEITGSYQQLIIPGVYAGGELRFRIRGDATGTAAVELDACTVGSVGGKLIPGLIELEATVKYGYFIGIDGNTFRPGIVLGMSGRALLLSGLLGFSLCVEGRLILQRLRLDPDDPEKTSVRLRGDILVAGTVTLAWAVKKRKSFHTTYDVNVDWQTLLVAAKAGILPVP
ncbi:hypothetical protein ACIP96_35260 [Streptomyces nigra]|uniref:hypothetical protein n=1 Tax=Streptomyces nigra TaxID=1827580 RepID=UPI0037FEE540